MYEKKGFRLMQLLYCLFSSAFIFISCHLETISGKKDVSEVINNMEIAESRFYDMNEVGFSLISYNLPSSDLNDVVSNMIIEECTFANTFNNQSINGIGVTSLEELFITNCTFYKVAEGTTLINISSSGPDITTENSLFAGEALTNGATIRGNSRGLISATQNYATTKENMASTPIGRMLFMDQEDPMDVGDLFRNASEYNFTMIDFTGLALEEYVGDPYWF